MQDASYDECNDAVEGRRRRRRDVDAARSVIAEAADDEAVCESAVREASQPAPSWRPATRVARLRAVEEQQREFQREQDTIAQASAGPQKAQGLLGDACSPAARSVRRLLPYEAPPPWPPASEGLSRASSTVSLEPEKGHAEAPNSVGHSREVQGQAHASGPR